MNVTDLVNLPHRLKRIFWPPKLPRGGYRKPELNGEQKARLEARSKQYDNSFLNVQLPEIPTVPGMITPNECKYLYWLTSQGYTGAGGEVVEVGTWLGRSTIHLGAGLRDGHSQPPLYCFDRYDWNKFYEQDYLNPGISLEEGTDFKPYFEKNARQVYENIIATKTRLADLVWDRGPIEILFLDAPKSLRDISTAIVTFGRFLVPDYSIVVFQDYLHAPSYPIAMLIATLKSHFRILHIVPQSSTVAFMVVSYLPFARIDPDWNFMKWDLTRILQVWDYILSQLDEHSRCFIEPGLAMLLWDRGMKDEAASAIRKVVFTEDGLKRWLFMSRVTQYAKYEKLFEYVR